MKLGLQEELGLIEPTDLWLAAERSIADAACEYYANLGGEECRREYPYWSDRWFETITDEIDGRRRQWTTPR